MRISILLISLFFTSATFAQNSYLPFVDTKRLPSEEEMLAEYGGARAGELAKDLVFTATVWNVYKFKKEQARDEMRTLSAVSDFMLLQESMMGGDFDDFFKAIENWLWISAISFFNADDVGTGVTTGGRLQPNLRYAVRSTAIEPVAGTPKMFAITRYPVEGDGGDLIIANIHSVNFVPIKAYSSQIEQLEAALKDHTGPLLIGGDFNTHLPARMGRLKEMMERLSLRQVVFDNQRYDRMILDHIFVRDIDPISAHVLYDFKSSDHYPLYGTFSLQ